MMIRYIFIVYLFFLGCDSLIEKSSPLEGQFYIQDGWLAFGLKNFDEARKHFDTVITNEMDPVTQFLAYIGLGWTDFYEARYFEEISSNGFVKSSGSNLDSAHNIIMSIDDDNISNDLLNLYLAGQGDLFAGLALQRNYLAKQISANIINWQSTNSSLADSINSIYEESIIFSQQIERDYIFKYDSSLVYIDLLILRIESLVILGKFEDAILNYNELILEVEIDITSDCKEGVTSQNLVECLCIITYDGNCPFDN